MPWNLVEGLAWTPENGGEWMVAAEDPSTGLYDDTYGCQRCHMLGTTMNGTDKTVPNPAASISPSAGTAVQWARDETITVDDFHERRVRVHAGSRHPVRELPRHGPGDPHRPRHRRRRLHDARGPRSVAGVRPVPRQLHGRRRHGGHLRLHDQPAAAQLRRRQRRLRRSVVHQDPDGGRVHGHPHGLLDVPQRQQCQGRPLLLRRVGRLGALVPGRRALRDGYPTPTPTPWRSRPRATASTRTTSSAPTRSPPAATSATPARATSRPRATRSRRTSSTSADTVGKMGQECITCHNGHPTASAQPMSCARTRPASAAPLWATRQRQHLRGLPQLADGSPRPDAESGAHGRPLRSRRREPPAARDAAWSQRHVRRRQRQRVHARRQVRRLPHAQDQQGRQPHLPRHEAHAAGRRPAWNDAGGAGYNGEDSCTGCHSSRTRDQLQASIDGWQEDATAKATDVVNAITAAKTRSEFSAKVTTNPATRSSARPRGTTRSSRTTRPPECTIRSTSWPASSRLRSWPSRSAASSPTPPASPSVRKGRTGSCGRRRQW